jgi:hypothetical protein
MKVLLEMPDNKASSILAILNSIPKVKIKAITDTKALIMTELREAVEEMKLIKSDKKKARNIDEFLNEL